MRPGFRHRKILAPPGTLAGAAMIQWRKRRNEFIADPNTETREPMAKINPGEFMRQVQAEGRKVVWPTRQETVTTAIFVGIMMVILSVFFLGVDSVFGWIVQELLTLA
jgi:preprotein translocase subunit SecE